MSEAALATADDKPKRPWVGRKLRTVIDLMVFDGVDMADAARKAKTSTRAIRKAFERPHVLRYVQTRKQVLRASISAQNIRRAAEIRDQDDNKMASLGAIRLLEQMGEEAAAAPSRQQTPGVVIVIGDAALTAHKRGNADNHLIEHGHVQTRHGEGEG